MAAPQARHAIVSRPLLDRWRAHWRNACRQEHQGRRCWKPRKGNAATGAARHIGYWPAARRRRVRAIVRRQRQPRTFSGAVRRSRNTSFSDWTFDLPAFVYLIGAAGNGIPPGGSILARSHKDQISTTASMVTRAGAKALAS